MRTLQVGSAGSHKGSIHKKLCAHYAWIFRTVPWERECDAEVFRAKDAYFTIRPNPLSLLPKGALTCPSRQIAWH